LTELNGSPVTSVIGESPLHTWGKALQKLGLIDEIMFERAIEAVHEARTEGIREAKDKFDNRHSKSTPAEKRKDDSDSRAASPVLSAMNVDDDAVKQEGKEGEDDVEADDKEPPSEAEKLLRAKVESLMAELEAVKEEDKAATLALANARINDLGQFLCNPFDDDESWKSQEASWLAIAVRKEKARMGSTGNKRKIVTAVDLLERNNTFFNPDIEALIEGLPGSEFCDPYVFQAFRSGGPGSLNRSWIHEAQVRNEKEVQQRIQRTVETQVKEEHDQERVVKRKQRDDDRDSRKRQKLTEDEERKKIRADERLSRLEIQINERLYKEAAFQREKVVVVLARNLSKEFARRRKAAEILSTQSILDSTKSEQSLLSPNDIDCLPQPTRVYNEDAVRVWNFMTTFRGFFLQRGYVKNVPTLQSLQLAVDCLNGDSKSKSMTISDAVSKLTDLSVALCKPLAASLTRSLFASLIALNPALQKDFGAAFFHGVNATATEIKCDSREGELASSPSDCLLPVNSMTWQEVARLAFLSDALAELGQSKHEAAHLLRGYRSAGHPNSKESRRLRKTEDFAIAILRQKISQGRSTDGFEILGGSRFWVDAPCAPVAVDSFHEDCAVDPERRRDSVGLLGCLSLSDSDYKKLSSSRERYMEDALVLKDEMERQKLQDADDDDDDDEDDDDEEQVDNVAKKGKGDKKPSGKHLSKTGSDFSVTTPVASSVYNDPNASIPRDTAALQKIGKETPYDEFCGDMPQAPEVIRRCLAVLRTLAVSGPAEPFLYPVDPQSNPGYYDMVMRPMSLRKVGLELYDAIEEELENAAGSMQVRLEDVVVEFGRNVRLIEQNCLTYTNAGPMVVAAGSELLRLFERLFFDWVLAPEHLLPPLESLDDDKCVEHDASDSDAIVLLCDGCEGKWNIHRLDPPLLEIPKGDWYCARCISGRWYGTTDPRLGKAVRKSDSETPNALGTIAKCFYSFPESAAVEASLIYLVQYEDGTEERWPLREIDEALAQAGTPAPPIRWLRAVVESPGYGLGVDAGLRRDVIPAPLNPNVSDAAAQVALSSSVFRDTITAAGTLLITDPRDMTAVEWLRLLVLLVMKCSSSDAIQNVVSTMENEAAEGMAGFLEKVKKVQVARIQEILPEINGGELVASDDWLPSSPSSEHHRPEPHSFPLASTSEVSTPSSTKPSTIVVGSEAVEIVDETRVDSSTLVDGAVSGEVANIAVEQELCFASALQEKSKRQKTVEESFAAYCIKEQMKPIVASFEEDSFSSVVDASMSSNEVGLSFSSLRCRNLVCSFCGLTDVALGLPLVRVPDEEEWDAVFPHSARSSRPYLIADVVSPLSRQSKLVAVTLKVDGEIFSCADTCLQEIKDGGMLEFVPRSDLGFQNEMTFRYECGLPFVSGSLSAHESCSVAVHNARKERTVQRYKAKQAELVEKKAGMACGRTLEIGRDDSGRSYWEFDSDPSALFVCVENAKKAGAAASGTWHYYQFPENIASVILCLGKTSVAKELRKAYPEANQMIRDGTWTERILKRAYPHVSSSGAKQARSTSMKTRKGFEVCYHHPLRFCLVLCFASNLFPEQSYRNGEEVLVESKSTKLLWDAFILSSKKIETEQSGGSTIVDAYQVHYKNWSSRYSEWVKPDRVLEANERNRELQVSKCAGFL
jgi:Bromodomain